MPSFWEERDREERNYPFYFGGLPFRGRNWRVSAKMNQQEEQEEKQEEKEVRRKTGRRNLRKAQKQ